MTMLTHSPVHSGDFQFRFLSQLAHQMCYPLMFLCLATVLTLPAWAQHVGDTEKSSVTVTHDSSSKTIGCRPLHPSSGVETGFRLSDLNKRFPLGQLSAEIAAYIGRFSDTEQYLRFRQLPAGLQQLVFLHASPEMQENISRSMFAQLLREHPGASQTVTKIYSEYKTVLPVLARSRQEGYVSTTIGRNFVSQLTSKLTPDEIKFLNTTVAPRFPSTLSSNFPEEYRISSAGMKFLHENAQLFPTASRILQMIDKSDPADPGGNPPRVHDGFLEIQDDLVVRNAGCVCYIGGNCGRWFQGCGSDNCSHTGHRQCGYFWTWVECTSLCPL